ANGAVEPPAVASPNTRQTPSPSPAPPAMGSAVHPLMRSTGLSSSVSTGAERSASESHDRESMTLSTSAELGSTVQLTYVRSRASSLVTRTGTVNDAGGATIAGRCGITALSRPNVDDRHKERRMPKMKMTIPHTLGQDEARQRVQGMISNMKEQYGDKVSDLEEEWSGDT